MEIPDRSAELGHQDASMYRTCVGIVKFRGSRGKGVKTEIRKKKGNKSFFSRWILPCLSSAKLVRKG